MLSDLTPAQITMLAAVISYEILVSVDNNEANAINNFLSLLASNLSVQLAQQALLEQEDEQQTGKKDDDNQGTIDEDITPLFSV